MQIQTLKYVWIMALFFNSVSVYAKNIPVIAAASSVKFALEEISQQFTQDHHLTVKFSFSSSGNLMRQIQYNSPFELFLSADETSVLKLHALGLTTDKGIEYARGRLVLFTSKKSPIKKDSQLTDVRQALDDRRLKRFAIANPDHAPYGIAAKQVLQTLNLWQGLQKKLVLGENVAQAAQFSSRHAVQAGIFAYSLALKMKPQMGSYILLPQRLHPPLIARMVLLKSADETAKAFYHYLQQAKARAIFEKNGFYPP
ncbi:MAG: molybdate ABC transporter substrate-binding protein [Methylococcales bacterium]|nr:molybdate ABC transporter substrate-binding protein [Methylococcales bacterium]